MEGSECWVNFCEIIVIIIIIDYGIYESDVMIDIIINLDVFKMFIIKSNGFVFGNYC